MRPAAKPVNCRDKTFGYAETKTSFKRRICVQKNKARSSKI